jgi:hypothetical protein
MSLTSSDTHKPLGKTWLPVTSDSFRASSNQPIFKATPRRQARA